MVMPPKKKTKPDVVINGGRDDTTATPATTPATRKKGKEVKRRPPAKETSERPTTKAKTGVQPGFQPLPEEAPLDYGAKQAAWQAERKELVSKDDDDTDPRMTTSIIHCSYFQGSKRR